VESCVAVEVLDEFAPPELPVTAAPDVPVALAPDGWVDLLPVAFVAPFELTVDRLELVEDLLVYDAAPCDVAGCAPLGDATPVPQAAIMMPPDKISAVADTTFQGSVLDCCCAFSPSSRLLVLKLFIGILLTGGVAALRGTATPPARQDRRTRLRRNFMMASLAVRARLASWRAGEKGLPRGCLASG
jgi:hypothetical protein